MASSSYWSELSGRRLNRRRALAASSMTALSAALLAACGGDDSTQTSDKSGIVSQPEDTSKSAMRGGTLGSVVVADATTFDMTQLTPGGNRLAGFTQSMLLRVKPGYLERTRGELEGDLAIGPPEISGDGLQFTFKIRPNLTWHPIAPVNGRPVIADDFRFSWQAFADRGASRAALVNAVNPDAPIVSFETPDNSTVLVKLKEPAVAAAQSLLGFRSTGYLYILPKEGGDGSLDLRTKVVGTGPYYLSEYEPSSRFVFRRFDNFYDKDRVHLDSVEQPIISEYAARLSQFKAGAIIEGVEIPAEDILLTLQDQPELKIYSTGFPDTMSIITFGHGYQDGPQPLRDERVRQAFSMSIDRDLFLDIGSDAEKLRANGLPVENRWHTMLSAGFYEGWWLDPKSSEFGPNARYYKHDVAEAKKLLAAAGFGNGFETTAHFLGGGGRGPTFDRDMNIIQGMVTEAGIRFKQNPLPQSEFTARIQNAVPRRNYDGMSFTTGPFTQPDAVERLYTQFHPKGPFFAYFDAAGRGDGSGDPTLTAQLEKARLERDTEKRRDMVHDMQRYLGKTQYDGRFPGVFSNYQLAWPALKNFLVYQNDPRRLLHVWLDPNEAPLKKS